MKKVKISYGLTENPFNFVRGSLYKFVTGAAVESIVLCTDNDNTLEGVIVAHTDLKVIGQVVTGFNSTQYKKFSGSVVLED